VSLGLPQGHAKKHGFISTEAIFYKEFLITKGATACLRICGNIALSGKNICQALYFANGLFRIEQLTMLFAVQEVLY